MPRILRHAAPAIAPGAQLGRRQRRRKQVALPPLDAMPAQVLFLLPGLDAFGGHVQVQALRQPDDGFQHHGIHRLRADAADERTVDLEKVRMQLLQIGQRTLPRAEIVQCPLHAQLAQLPDIALRLRIAR
ncbi:hypothetical protein G039_0310330 [Pseudomonas aeruginosa VRFPA01]|nr:hypothetical protein G039_0310330 [Pseudomonas aeruginosa VRFPA01]